MTVTIAMRAFQTQNREGGKHDARASNGGP